MPALPVPHGDDDNTRMREASGVVTNESPLATFLYLLARDCLAVGQIERLLDQTLSIQRRERVYNNGWLAQWAEDAEARLKAT